MELFICCKILFWNKNMNWGKTAHGLIAETAIEQESQPELELQEV